MTTRQTLQPAGWPRPKGYSNGVAATGRHVYTAGVVGWNQSEEFECADLAGQFRQVLLNTRAILAEAGAAPADIVRMTCYVTDIEAYRHEAAAIGAAWREVFGRAFPCMALVQVVALVEPKAMIEIETIAVIDDRD